MDFRLTADEKALRGAARSLLARESPPSLARARYSDTGAPAAALWTAVTEAGWLGLLLAPAAGGLGLGVVEAALVCEEVGRALAPVPVWETAALAAPLLAAGGGDAAAERLIGGARATAPTVPGEITVGPGGRLSGTLQLVPEAHLAELIVVPAGGTVWVVEAQAATLVTHDCLDRTRVLSDVVLDGTAAATAGRLEAETLAHATATATVTLAAETLGTARALLDTTVAYVGVREQFGVPVGSFQAVAHKLADVLVGLERAWAATYHAAMCLDARAPDAARAVAVAAAATGDASRQAARDAVQCHGGIGYTWEHDLHLAVRRVYADEPLLGSSAQHRARLADLLEV